MISLTRNHHYCEQTSKYSIRITSLLWLFALFALWLYPSIQIIQELSDNRNTLTKSKLVAGFSECTLIDHNLFVSYVWDFLCSSYHNLFGFLQNLHRWLLLNPLRYIYLYGPSLGGFGFWNGQDVSDICTQLSKGVGSMRFWNEHLDECELQIDKQVVALSIFVWLLFFALTCYLLIQMFMWQYYQYAVLRPTLRELCLQSPHFISSKQEKPT